MSYGPPAATYTGALGTYTPEQLRLRRARKKAQLRRRRRGARLVSLGGLLVVTVAVVATLGSFGGHGTTTRAHDRTRAQLRLAGKGQGARTLSVGGEPASALPFPPNPADRLPKPGEVPSLYADGLACSTGCRPYGAEFGWPIKPFHREHGLRAGLNELRPGSMHVGLDIQAHAGAAVYAVQPGVADVLTASGPNARVQVGDYIYWHINPAVSTGEPVEPFKTVLGHVMFDYGHLALSELDGAGGYVNPLRPDGIVLSPYANHAPPEIATPEVSATGQVVVAAYSPQTFVRTTTYPTPVLAPAALAWRLYSLNGTAVTPLQWAFRGTHLLPFAERDLIYAPGAQAPGFGCFARKPVCVPHWIYRVADGLTPPMPTNLFAGRYRLTIYAWDWADNKTALDTTVTLTAAGWRPIGRFPPSLSTAPDYYSLLADSSN